MTHGTATPPSQREDRTIIAAIGQEEYEKIVGQAALFRAWIDRDFRLNPENYPKTFGEGYKLHDKNTSTKNGVGAFVKRGRN